MRPSSVIGSDIVDTHPSRVGLGTMIYREEARCCGCLRVTFSFASSNVADTIAQMRSRRALGLLLLLYAALIAGYQIEQAARSPFYSVTIAAAEIFDRIPRRMSDGALLHAQLL